MIDQNGRIKVSIFYFDRKFTLTEAVLRPKCNFGLF